MGSLFRIARNPALASNCKTAIRTNSYRKMASFCRSTLTVCAAAKWVRFFRSNCQSARAPIGFELSGIANATANAANYSFSRT
jgi:hypothetical protein